MILHDKISGYCCAIILSLWSVVLPPGEFSHIDTGIRSGGPLAEKVESLHQFDPAYLVSQSNLYSSIFRINAAPDLNHFFNEHAVQYFLLNNACIVAFALTTAIELQLEFIDLIFPYHYFW